MTNERTPLLPASRRMRRHNPWRPEPADPTDVPLQSSIHNLRTYITLAVTGTTDRSDITDRDSPIVTEQFLRDAITICEDNDSVAYCALRCVEKFQQLSDKYPQWSDVFDNRAVCAQMLARKFVSTYSRRSELFTDVLLKKRPSQYGRHKNALELAVDLHATLFLSDPEVSKCVEGLWNGAIIPIEDGAVFQFHHSDQNEDGSPQRPPLIDAARIAVPMYKNVLNIIFSIAFLILYTLVVNNAAIEGPDSLEWIMYFWVVGYVLDELEQIFNGGLFYFYSLWNCLSFLIYLIFIGAFTLRVLALTTTDAEHRLMFNNAGLDVLSTLAIFLWMRVLSILDTWHYFGSYSIILQSMFKDGIIFFLLLVWVLLGFSQAFLALRGSTEKDDLKEITELLIQGYLSSPDFEHASEFHPVLGHTLYVMFIFITVVVLQSLLYSLFSASFQNVIDQSQAEYLASFTFKTLSLLEERYSLPSPFNMIGIFIILPFRLFLSKNAYRTIYRWFATVAFLLVLVVIGWYERGPGRTQLEAYRFYNVNESEEDDMPLQPTREDLDALERLLGGGKLPNRELGDGTEAGPGLGSEAAAVKSGPEGSGGKGNAAAVAHGEMLERRMAMGKVMDVLAVIEKKLENIERK